MAGTGKRAHPFLKLLGIGVVVFLALLAALDFLGATATADRFYQDPYRIGEHQERLREVAALLPADSVIGFLSDLLLEDTRGAAAFFAVQYALAPRLLVLDKPAERRQWVLGYFSQSVDLGKTERENGLSVVRTYGAGIVLFRRQAAE